MPDETKTRKSNHQLNSCRKFTIAKFIHKTRSECPKSVQNLVKKLPVWDGTVLLITPPNSPKRRPIDFFFRAPRANVKTVFILITNWNLNFKFVDNRSHNRCQRQHDGDDMKICFMHTSVNKHQSCQFTKLCHACFTLASESKILNC